MSPRHLVLASAILALPLQAAQATQAAQGASPTDPILRVEAATFRNARGDAGCLLFKASEGFPDQTDKAWRVLHVPIEQGRAVCEFKDVPAGTYAVVVLHDENLNHKMDKNFLGIPQEGWGVSNNVRPVLSAPRFQDATFTVKPSAPATVSIQLGY
jgi:uncharacterized protein (DUF2141 family)